MALKMNYVFKGVLPIDNCYIRIAHIDGNKNKIFFNLQYYTSKEVSDIDQANNNPNNALNISKNYSFTPDLNSADNLYTQMYQYLLSLPEFAEAVSV